MAMPMLLAVRTDEATIDRHLEIWKARLDAFFDLGPENASIVSRSHGVAMISIQPRLRIFDVPLVHHDERHHVASGFYLYQDTPEEAWSNRSDYLRRAFESYAGDPDKTRHLSPPAVLFAHDRREGTVRIVNDFLGSSKLYCHEGQGIDVLSTRIAAIPMLLGSVPPTDEQAWRMHASFDWVSGDSTFLSSITMLAPGSSVEMTAHTTTIRETHGTGYLIGRLFAKNMEVDDPLEVLTRRFRNIASFARNEPPDIGLTGGRDSRLVAALAITGNVTARYKTSYPPELEVEIARQLVDRSPVPMDWHSAPHLRFAASPAQSLESRAASWFAETEGDCWPQYVRNDYPYEERAAGLPSAPFIAGVGGELLRAFLYSATNTNDPMGHIQSLIDIRRKTSRLLTQAARDAAAETMQRQIEAGRRIGITGLHLLDWYFARYRLSRRVPAAFQHGKAYPIVDSNIFVAAFPRGATEKAEARFPRSLTATLMPAWSDVPYFTDLASTLPHEQVNKIKTMPYHWEVVKRPELLGILQSALALSQANFQPDLVDQYRTIERGDPRANDMQNGIDKLTWRLGFEAYRARMVEVLGRHAGSRHFSIAAQAVAPLEHTVDRAAAGQASRPARSPIISTSPRVIPPAEAATRPDAAQSARTTIVEVARPALQDNSSRFAPLQVPIFVAIRADEHMIERQIGLWKARLDAFFDLGPENVSMLSRSRGLAMITIQPRRRILDVPLVHCDDDDHIISAYYLFQDTPEDAWLNRSDYLRRAFLSYANNSEGLWKLPPPAALCAHDMRAGTIRIINDFLGIARIYAQRSSGLDVISTRLAAVPLITGSLPSTNEQAWQQQSSFDWIVSDDSYLSDVSMLAPGSCVEMTEQSSGIRDTHGVGGLIGRMARRELEPENPLRVLRRRYGQIATFARDGRPNIGLSGGRDSRLIAALALTAGTQARFTTAAPPQLEVEIAEQLVANASVEMNWRSSQRAAMTEPPQMSLADRAAYWFSETDGDCWPQFVRSDYPVDERAVGQRFPLSITGIGGELLRSTFYEIGDATRPEARLRQMTSARRTLNSLLTQDARDRATASMLAVFDLGRNAGIDGLYLLDWFYARSKMRRRVPMCFQFGKSYPLVDANLFLSAFHAPPADKARARFQKQLVDSLVPQWQAIPYFGEVASFRSIATVNKHKPMPFHWEVMDRNVLLEFLAHAVDLSRASYAPNAADRYRTVERGDRIEVDLQSNIDKLAWRVGFETYRQRITEVLGRRQVGGRFDFTVGAGVD